MTNAIKVLYVHWISTMGESSKTIRSWTKMDKAITKNVPQGQQEAFTALLDEHCNNILYRGYTAGFKAATKLCKQTM